MNGHSSEGIKYIGSLTAEEVLELEAEEAYWLYYQEQQEAKGDCDDREERTKTA